MDTENLDAKEQEIARAYEKAKEKAQALEASVRRMSGVVFVRSSDYEWMFKDGALVASGHSVDGWHASRALTDVDPQDVDIEDEDVAEAFDNLTR